MSEEKQPAFDHKDFNINRNKFVQSTYVSEGKMVAFPLCFPGASQPIPPDESRITALDVTPEGNVYGGTSGYRSHLFVGMFGGATGLVFDMGAVEDSTSCAAICCGETKFMAFVNGPGGGRLITRELEILPYDLLQEWWMSRPPLEDLGHVVDGESFTHAVTESTGRYSIGCTDGHLISVEIDTGNFEVIDELRGIGKLAVGSNGNIFGCDSENTLWRYEPEKKKLSRKAVDLPGADWNADSLVWARDPVDGTLFTADTGGNLYSFREDSGFSKPLGKTPLAPVTAMAVTLDGRVFGACGKEIAKIFCHDRHEQKTKNLEVAISVIQRRRYGYQFADAVTGRDGEILFGENDNFGHLWIYFPRIRKIQP